MLNNDYNKQYERRQRIKKTTLVTGVKLATTTRLQQMSCL